MLGLRLRHFGRSISEQKSGKFCPLLVSMSRAQRVHVSNNCVLGIWVWGIVILVCVMDRYMINMYLDP